MAADCEIITVGDEILQGRTINSNAAYVGKALTALGIRVRWSNSVADDLGEITAAIRQAIDRARLVVMTGGLGPTPDDLTRDAICSVFDLKLIEDTEQRAHVEAMFKKFGRYVPEESRNQFLVPDGATRIHNPGGTAAGIQVERKGKYLLAFPGVPQELEEMTREYLAPFAHSVFPNAAVHSKTLRLAGIGESLLLKELGDRSELEQHVQLAYLPNHGLLDVRLTAHAEDSHEADAQIAFAEQYVRERAGRYVYAVGEVRLEQVIGDILLNRAQKLAIAESCTGGLIASRFTDIPGASRWFERGFVTYSNAAKCEHLNVPESLIAGNGAVSEEVACAMAEGAKTAAGTEWAVSSTGIAGPDGDTLEKPVGTVWIAVASSKKTSAKLLRLGSVDRERIKLRATHAVQFELYRALVDAVH